MPSLSVHSLLELRTLPSPNIPPGLQARPRTRHARFINHYKANGIIPKLGITLTVTHPTDDIVVPVEAAPKVIRPAVGALESTRLAIAITRRAWRLFLAVDYHSRFSLCASSMKWHSSPLCRRSPGPPWVLSDLTLYSARSSASWGSSSSSPIVASSSYSDGQSQGVKVPSFEALTSWILHSMEQNM